MPRHTLTKERSIPDAQCLIERMVERDNMVKALNRVKQNKGASGIDGMTVDELPDYLQSNWRFIKEQLLKGIYRPKPVRRVEIPKANGGKRLLGVPTVLDRMIQQAMKQVLSPIFDPEFFDNSYGFRPGRNAHQAVLQAKSYQHSGKRWVVDMDLAQFFDEVNHDILVSRLARRVKDRRMISLIRVYLKAGVMIGGVTCQTPKGTPQGGPLSPLLSNIMLDDLDKELKRRGHKFCRYADDGVVHCRTKREADELLKMLDIRFKECGLELHPEKTKIIYCKDDDRRFNYSDTSFDFLSYTFRPRRAKNRWGKYFVSFLPAVSNKAGKAMRQKARRWKMHLRSDKSLEDLSRMFSPVIRGWIN